MKCLKKQSSYGNKFVGVYLDANINKYRYRYVMKNGRVINSKGYVKKGDAEEKLKEVLEALKNYKLLTIKCCN